MKNLRRIMSYLGEYKKYAFLAPLMVCFEVLLEIWIPYLMANIIDVGIANKDVAYVTKTGLLMVLLAVGGIIFGALAGRYGAVCGTGLARKLREAIFNKIQDFSFANVDHFSAPSLITRLTTDMTFVQNSAMMTVRALVRGPMMMVSAVFMTFKINSELAMVYLAAIPILAFSFIFISTKAHKYFVTLFEKYDVMNASIQENLIGIRVVKSFVRRDHENKKMQLSVENVMNAAMRAERIVIFQGPIMQFIINFCIIMLIWFGGNLIIGGSMKTGELISFINYTNAIMMQMMMINMVLITVVISQASMRRILEVIDEKLDITDETADENLKVENGSITFDHVFFSYVKRDNEEEMTLQDIDLEIKSGELVGIIGATGSAKSTLVNLIPRLYDVSKGQVLVGGHNVKDYKLRTLRDAVSIVLQKNVLFSGTIRDNLKWGDENASDEEIIEAAKSAQAHDFIMSFPEGYDTDLDQGGVNVSGGQKQRLCIARALLKKPKVMILDDSTSAVDTATESLIRKALRERHNDITTIIIAQRITSVMDADKIIVLDEGKINAIGNHEELMKNNEIYREVFESQQKGAE